MKIVVIGYSKDRYLKTQVVGGMQLVERNQLRLLSENGHDVHYITGTDSEQADGVTQYATVPSKYSPEGLAMGNKRIRLRNQMVRVLIENIQPDVIVSHDDPNGSLLKALVEIGIPSVTFVHSDVAQSGGPGIIGYMQGLAAYAAAGHVPVCVSDYSRENWVEQVRKSAKFLGFDNGSDIFTKYCWPAVVWEKPELVPAEYGFVTVGRPDKFKNHQYAVKSVRPLHWFTTKPKNDAEQEILDTLAPPGYDYSCSINAPRHELMDYVGRSRALIFSGLESFGLTCVEANMQGVPVVIVSKKDRHSGREACGLKDENYVFVQPKDLKSVTDSWDDSKFDRAKIQQNAWETFNPKASYDRLFSILKYAQERRLSFTSESNQSILFT